MAKKRYSKSPVKDMQAGTATNIAKVVNSGYSDGGASRTKKSLKGMTAKSLNPENDINLNLPLLRSRSRSVYMTAPIATSAIKTTKTNVVGGGLKLKPRIDYEVLGLTEDQATEWEKAVKREFSLWADSKMCDIYRMNNFYEMQQLIFLGVLMNGEGFSIRRYENPTPYMPYGLRLQIIEADRICTPSSSGFATYANNLWGKAENGNEIFDGIELNANGAAIAYHICNQYPYITQVKGPNKPYEWERVDAYGKKTGMANVLHIFEPERAEQRRGVPMLAPIIEALKQLSRYTDAELMAAVISAMFTVFIKTTSPTSDMPLTEGIPESADKVSTDPNEYEMGNGLINILGENESIEIADPKRPNTAFDGFVNATVKQIGAALEIPKELLLKEFNSSYSASRAALLEAWKMFKSRREMLAREFCQPVYEFFLTEAVANGRIKAPGFFTDPIIKAWCQANWNGAAAGMIDPTKEVNAAKMRVEEGFSTREEETMGLTGGDYDANARQLKKENEILVEAKKILSELKITVANVQAQYGNDDGKGDEQDENE